MSKHAKPLPGTPSASHGRLYIRRRIDLAKDDRFKIDVYGERRKVIAVGRSYALRFDPEKGAFVSDHPGDDFLVYMHIEGTDGEVAMLTGYLDKSVRGKIAKMLRGYAKKHPAIEIESYS